MAAMVQFFKDMITPPECGFSNATDYNVKFQLHQDRKLITKSEKEIGGGVGAKYAGTGGNVNVNYKSKEEAEYSLVDPQFQGFTTVNKGTRLDLKDNPYSSGTAYITVALILPSEKLRVHTLNHPVNAGSCNYMLGTNRDGELEFVKLHRNRTWRADGTSGTQNYYGNRVCGACKEQYACKKDCSDLAEFGGHSLGW